MIKFEHSVFALPFALVGALLGRSGRRCVADVAADPMDHRRNGGCTLRRDDHEPYRRHRVRPPESSHGQSRAAERRAFGWFCLVAFTMACSTLLVVAAWQLNPLALRLSPVALAILFFYSYTKRFTAWSHFVLGFCLGMSPAAAWIAIRGSLDPRMLILCAAVTLWVGGFDVLYACQDVEFDKTAGLVFDSEKVWHCASAAHCARDAHRHGRPAGVARAGVFTWRGPPGPESQWLLRCWPTSIRS